MFSPYYARARARSGGDPEDHCAINVALYRLYGDSWVLTERRGDRVRRDARRFEIGASALEWRGEELLAAIDERTAPWGTRVRGALRLRPLSLVAESWNLDPRGRHRWQPIAPCARIEVDFERPRMRWSGSAYFDTNAGDAPLEDAFANWNWSRMAIGGDTLVQYDISPRPGPAGAGSPRSLALRFSPEAAHRELEALPSLALPRTGWGVARATPCDPGSAPSIERTLEDTPFYARSLVRQRAFGAQGVAVHESLSLDRFRRPWVKALLPFRMWRR